MDMSYAARSVEETEEIGSGIGASLERGAVLGLIGDLGAGKTHLVKGIVKNLGSDDRVTSPTFSIVNEYRNGRVPVFHFDFYRLQSGSDAERIGWWDYVDERGVIVVEWADMFPRLFPGRTVWWKIRAVDERTREIANCPRPFGEDDDDE